MDYYRLLHQAYLGLPSHPHLEVLAPVRCLRLLRRRSLYCFTESAFHCVAQARFFSVFLSASHRYLFLESNRVAYHGKEFVRQITTAIFIALWYFLLPCISSAKDVVPPYS